MLESWSLGGISTLVFWIGIIMLGYEFVQGSDHPVVYFVSLGIIAYSRYMKYLSKHAMRIRE